MKLHSLDSTYNWRLRQEGTAGEEGRGLTPALSICNGEGAGASPPLTHTAPAATV
jgi:hypothetical protein